MDRDLSVLQGLRKTAEELNQQIQQAKSAIEFEEYEIEKR